MGYQLVDPVTEPVAPPGQLAPRLDTLDGTRIGLWANLKLNSIELLDQVEHVLKERYQIAGTVRGSYNAGRVMAPDEWGDIDGCDAVILTHGD